MTTDQLLDALLGTKESFESAVARVRGAAGGELLVSILTRLDAQDGLDNSERERRLKSVFTRVSLTAPELVSLANAGAKVSNAVLRNALTQLLPPEYRGAVFQGKQATPPQQNNLAVAADALAFHDDIAAHVSAVTEQQASFSDVIVLSLTDDPATKKLLESAKFVPLRCSSVEALGEMISNNEEICAFLVESSFLSSLDRGQQAALINKLATYSTFAWLRFQEDALLQNNVEVGQLIASARCRTSQPEVTDVSFRDKAGLQERELASLISARSRLMEGEAHGLFIPGELAGLA